MKDSVSVFGSLDDFEPAEDTCVARDSAAPGIKHRLVQFNPGAVDGNDTSCKLPRVGLFPEELPRQSDLTSIIRVRNCSSSNVSGSESLLVEDWLISWILRRFVELLLRWLLCARSRE